jgi:hypothetical protein
MLLSGARRRRAPLGTATALPNAGQETAEGIDLPLKSLSASYDNIPYPCCLSPAQFGA